MGYKPILVGVINLSADSVASESVCKTPKEAMERALWLRDYGVRHIDIGAKSSMPDGKDISESEEAKKLIPVLRMLKKRGFNVSIDTWSAFVADACLSNGADMINDTSGLQANGMAEIIRKYRRPVIVSYVNAPNPRERRQSSAGEFTKMMAFLKSRIIYAKRHGISRIILDPGIGFFKTDTHVRKIRLQLKVIKHLNKVRKLGYPVFINAPRKPRLHRTAVMAQWVFSQKPDYVRIHQADVMADILSMIKWYNDA